VHRPLETTPFIRRCPSCGSGRGALLCGSVRDSVLRGTLTNMNLFPNEQTRILHLSIIAFRRAFLRRRNLGKMAQLMAVSFTMDSAPVDRGVLTE
jgi:hypothetical protein